MVKPSGKHWIVVAALSPSLRLHGTPFVGKKPDLQHVRLGNIGQLVGERLKPHGVRKMAWKPVFMGGRKWHCGGLSAGGDGSPPIFDVHASSLLPSSLTPFNQFTNILRC